MCSNEGMILLFACCLGFSCPDLCYRSFQWLLSIVICFILMLLLNFSDITHYFNYTDMLTCNHGCEVIKIQVFEICI